MITNIEEATQLADRYDNIAVEIHRVPRFLSGLYIISILTGFSTVSCSLCLKVNNNCDYCIYQRRLGCKTDPTYASIANSESEEELIKACSARAKYIRDVVKSILYKELTFNTEKV